MKLRICIMNMDGTGLMTLTDGKYNDLDPGLAAERTYRIRLGTEPTHRAVQYGTLRGAGPHVFDESRLTNPDMLHVGIMPGHQSWASLFKHLNYVVIDEAHIYRGVFGSHVACVIRRLRRLCAFYGSHPQFILCTATVANPGEHAMGLTGLPCEVVDNDGSPRGWKDFVFWNPPFADEKKTNRKSPHWEATNLFTALVLQGTRTLTFTRTRRLCELIYVYTRDRLQEESYKLSQLVMPYRGGYMPEDRRNEWALFGGELLGVVATNALELGIDSGGLEATILDGYPGSISSTWQQAGRSGRTQGEALSFLVAWDNPLDQYFMRHPKDFFARGFEYVLVNPENQYICKSHLLCAAWERPLDKTDVAVFSPEMIAQRDELVWEGQLRERREGFTSPPAFPSPPTKSISAPLPARTMPSWIFPPAR